MYSFLTGANARYSSQNQDILTIAGIPVMAQYNITEMLSDFQTAFPNIKLQIEEAETTGSPC